MDLLDPFEVDDRHDPDQQIRMPRDVDFVRGNGAMEALVEEQVGARTQVLPRCERPGRLAERRGFRLVV